MSIEYTYDEGSNVVHSYLNGVVQVQDLENFVRRLLDDEKIQKGFIEVAHLDDMRLYKFAFTEAVDLPPLFNRLIKERGYAGSIFLVKSQYQYGMTRMFSALGENTGLTLRIARQDEEIPRLLQEIREPEQEN